MADVDNVLGAPDMGTMFSCPVCREMYNISDRSPKNIPCGHTICAACLPGLMGSRAPQFLMCPVCRKKHQASSDKDQLDLPKNFQLLSIIEKMIEVKKKLSEKKPPIPMGNCKECSKEYPEYELTTCTCILAERCTEVDFMKRQKNALVCQDCVRTNHKSHDFKPLDAVKTSWDCMSAIAGVRKTQERITEKSASVDAALDNAKKELAFLNEKLEKALIRLEARPRSPKLLAQVENLQKRVSRIEKSLTHTRGNLHSMMTSLGGYSTFLNTFGVKTPANVAPAPQNARNSRRGHRQGLHDPNVPADAPEIPVGDDGVLRVGNNGHFQFQFRIALEEGVAEGFHGEADRLVDQVVQRRLEGLMPLIRGQIRQAVPPGENGHADVDIELRPVHRRVQLQRVNEGEEGIVMEMAVNEVPMVVRQAEAGNDQVIVGADPERLAHNMLNAHRRVQRAYELLEVAAGPEPVRQVGENDDDDEEAEIVVDDAPQAPPVVQQPQAAVEPVVEEPAVAEPAVAEPVVAEVRAQRGRPSRGRGGVRRGRGAAAAAAAAPSPRATPYPLRSVRENTRSAAREARGRGRR